MYSTVIIVGNVGRDPEMRYTPSGQAVTSFSVATNRQYTNNNGESIKETTWFKVSAWGKQAETCNQYLRKGSKVLVEGRLTADPTTGGPRIWKAQDGSPRASFEISAGTVRFLSSRSEADSGSSLADDDAPYTDAGDDDIPF
ncbi:MAG TPA: single-stranded DNA-binding protein [Anaerolineales bacterium]|nr:single-stranded DNA-binding protein [Anaerolineales bacterium]